MSLRPIFSLAVCCTAFWLSIAAAAAEPTFPPGQRIGLTPPAGMTLSPRFPGFEDADRKAAVTMLELPPAAFQDIERAAFAENQKGLTNIKRESFPFASGIGILLSGAGTDGGKPVRKWFLIATAVSRTAPSLTAMISAVVPETAKSIYSDAVIRKALASVTFRPPPNDERLKLLPYHLENLAGFRVMQVTPGGDVILIDGDNDDLARHAYMIVSIGSGAPSGADERARFARDLLGNAPLRNLQVTLAEPMRILGAPGVEIRARAAGARGDPVTMAQWVRFSGSGFLRIVGVSSPAQWDDLFTRFRAVRDGINFR